MRITWGHTIRSSRRFSGAYSLRSLRRYPGASLGHIVKYISKYSRSIVLAILLMIWISLGLFLYSFVSCTCTSLWISKSSTPVPWTVLWHELGILFEICIVHLVGKSSWRLLSNKQFHPAFRVVDLPGYLQSSNCDKCTYNFPVILGIPVLRHQHQCHMG